jgi:hypothetical protein
MFAEPRFLAARPSTRLISPVDVLDLTDGGETVLHTHSHALLNDLQGGAPGGFVEDGFVDPELVGEGTFELYHVDLKAFSETFRSREIAITAVDLTLDENYHTVVVTATGKTISLPKASTAILGHIWTVIQDVVGTVTIDMDALDSLVGTDEITVLSTTRGTSLSFKCLSATTWGIV